MKVLVTDYTFDASAKTIVFNSFGSINIENVLLVVNVVDNEIIYNFGDPARGGTTSGRTLSLVYDTAGMDDADELLIYYDNGSSSQLIQAADSASVDPFGRWRVSAPKTIFDSKLVYDERPLFWDDAQISGSGTGSSHSVSNAAFTLTVGNTTAGTRVRQTKQWFNYQPGKGQLILCTGVLGAGATGITRRIGYFSTNNGLFFELAGTTLKVVRRTYVTGSAVDWPTSQNDWNIDKMDGTGVSGISIDTSKTQIFLIDFEWLGVGRVRFGFVVDGKIYYCHELLNANSLTTVYMSTPNLPIRYEISNDGTGGAASLVQICSSVASEGGADDIGVIRTDSNGNTPVAANAAGTLYACIGMKLKSGYLGTTIKNLTASMLVSTVNDMFEWQLLLNPTVAGVFTYSDVTNSAVQTAKGATANTVTGGTLINAGYAFAHTGVVPVLQNTLDIGAKIDGTLDAVILAVRPVASSTNLDVYTSLAWRELL